MDCEGAYKLMTLALVLAAAALPAYVAPVVTLLFICAFFAIIWFGISRLNVPEPVKTIVLVIVALIALFVVWQMFMGGGLLK